MAPLSSDSGPIPSRVAPTLHAFDLTSKCYLTLLPLLAS
jgi:hypothetical protein